MSYNFTGFTANFSALLQMPLPGQDAQYIMAGENIRHKKINLNALKGFKKSSVCLLLYEKENAPCFVLIKRPSTHKYHASQIALPGGSCDDNETYEQTAIRELYEETGISIAPGNILGRLTPLYIPVSNFYIQPIVACLQHLPDFKPHDKEVDALIEYRLADILNESIVNETTVNLTTGIKIKAPYFDVQGHILWGATAMLLSEVKQLLIANKSTFSFLFQ